MRVLFSRNFAYAKFRENKNPKKWRDHSVFDCYRLIMPMLQIFNIANMSLKAIAKIKFS